MANVRLVLIHDDGAPEIHIVVHGYSPVRSHPHFDELCCNINEAELRGRVYVCFWKSGHWKIPAAVTAISTAFLAPFVASVAIGQISRFLVSQHNSRETGYWLARHLHKIRNAHKLPITLIGHSLGCKVLFHTLSALNSALYDIRRVVLLAGAVQSTAADWESLAIKVRGEIVNVYSDSDWALYIRSPRCSLAGQKPIGSTRWKIRGSTRWKIRNVKCHLGHLDYLPDFDYILGRATPSRRRSANYRGQIEVECPHCECGDVLIVPANEEVQCTECRTDFWYEPEDKQCYWNSRPKQVGCSFCPDGEIYVQGTGRYQCPECRHWHDFARKGETVFISNAP